MASSFQLSDEIIFPCKTVFAMVRSRCFEQHERQEQQEQYDKHGQHREQEQQEQQQKQCCAIEPKSIVKVLEAQVGIDKFMKVEFIYRKNKC